jgi:general secretion pathway protein L
LLIRVHPDHLSFPTIDQSEDICVPRQADAALPAALRLRLEQCDEVVLLLPPHVVLRRTIELPVAARADLASAISFMVERHTPFPLELAHFTFRVTKHDKNRKVILVELAVIARTTLQDILASTDRHAISLTRIQIDGDDVLPPLVFAPLQSESRRSQSWRHQPWKPILAGGLALLVVGPFMLAEHIHAHALTLQESVAARAATARRGAQLRGELQTLIAATEFVPTREKLPRAIEIVSKLTKALPDDVWLFSFELNGDELRLAGFAANVPNLLTSLQAVPIFDAPAFSSPVVHGTDRDRFEISLRLKQVQL